MWRTRLCHYSLPGAGTRKRRFIYDQEGIGVGLAYRTDKQGLRRRDIADVGKVSIFLVKIQAVADHEHIRDLKAHVIRFDGNDAARVLIEQRGELQAGRVVRPQHFLQVAIGAARVEDVFHHQHIAAFDADVEVLGDLHFTGGHGAGAVALDAQKIHRTVDGNLPDEIRHENPGALQNAHQMRSPALVIAGNRRRRAPRCAPQSWPHPAEWAGRTRWEECSYVFTVDASESYLLN